MQCVLALVDIGCSLIYGNTDWFPGASIVIDGYGGKVIRMKQALIPLGIGHLPPKEYSLYIFPIPKYILGIDIL